MTLSSGRVFEELDLTTMSAAVHAGFITYSNEPFTLTAGGKSHVYVLGRDDTTEHGVFLSNAARIVLRDTRRIMDEAVDSRRPRFIGIPEVGHGWTPAFTTVDTIENITGRNTSHAIFRGKPKGYGARQGKWVEAEVDESVYRDIMFDNVVTGADTKLKASDLMVSDGFQRNQVDCMVFVDRGQGGFAEMQTMGFRSVHACYTLGDMVESFGKLNLWSGEQVNRVMREIEALAA